MKAVNSWVDPTDLSNFEPIPIKMLDGELGSTDGHTRCVSVLLHGLKSVPFVPEEDELDWEMYRRCAAACKERNIHSTNDLRDRIISASEYEIKWNQWCDEMQASIETERN